MVSRKRNVDHYLVLKYFLSMSLRGVIKRPVGLGGQRLERIARKWGRGQSLMIVPHTSTLRLIRLNAS